MPFKIINMILNDFKVLFGDYFFAKSKVFMYFYNPKS